MLIATRRRTWGPRGRPPVVHYNYKHDRISALAILTVSPIRHRVSVYVSLREDNFKAVHVGPVLRSLLQHVSGPIILLWDQGQIHKGPVIREVLLDHPRLQTEFFPKYAPELNPVEQVWHDFKRHTANSLPQDKRDLEVSIHSNTYRVRRSQNRLRSFVMASELPAPFKW
jgi:transposase